MKQIIFLGSTAAILTTAAIYHFRQGRKEKQHSPITYTNDSVNDENMTKAVYGSEIREIGRHNRECDGSAELSKLLQMSKKAIDGLSYAIQTSVKIDPRNYYGKLSIEYVLMLLELISDKMQDEQTLQDFFG